MKKYLRTAVYIILSLMAAVSILQGAKNALLFSQDLQYDAALALRCGINPYDESLDPTGILEEGATKDFYRIFKEAGAPQKMEANQFPSLLMLLFPITFLPYAAARVVWLILNLLFTAGIIFLLRKTFLREMDRDLFCWLMLLMLAGTPYRNQLGVGQHTLFSFFFFLLSVFLMERENAVLSGLSLAVSYFKYTLTAPLALYFIYKRKYKEFVISLIPHGILTFVAAFMLRESPMDMIIKPLKVSSILAGEGSIDAGAFFGGSAGLVTAALIMCGCLILSIVLKPGKDREVFSLLLLLSLIMTYHRSYDFFVLSAASCGVLLFENGREPVSFIKALYAAILIYFYFVLRIFNESSLSIAGAAVIYYVFVVLYLLYVLGLEKLCKPICHSEY